MTKMDSKGVEQLGSRVKRIAAIHDLCGYGACSLGVAMPVLTEAGHEVCAVPTAVFSAHTGYPDIVMQDLTPILESYLANWDAIGVKIDAIYTGFLGSAAQIDAILGYRKNHNDALFVVDPVMGDHGVVYRTYTDELCCRMRDLAQAACVITPNLTEAAVLLERPFSGQNIDLDTAKQLARDLKTRFGAAVVLKGIDNGDGNIYNIVCQTLDKLDIVSNRKVDQQLHGTGDLFASVLVGAMLNGATMVEATKQAGERVVRAIEVSKQQEGFEKRGVTVARS